MQLSEAELNELIDLWNLVAEMREAQKAFFLNRDPARLERAKQLEKRVDMVLQRLNSKQGKLL
ncbi:MAG: hypothetical protein GTN64_05645 [Candidatus Latescibacteria bacterium]|nr:hypothetical protein [Candidatus Latescibacterota bacterium]NIO78093.1 hypothetical protein [Candidatus Latescibacterota bacterium]